MQIGPVPTDFKKKGLIEWFTTVRNMVLYNNVIPSLTTLEIGDLPTPEKVGTTYFNTTTTQLYIWNGSGWTTK